MKLQCMYELMDRLLKPSELMKEWMNNRWMQQMNG